MTTTAVATRDNTPGALVKDYSSSFAAVLPSHIKPEAWVRLTQGALKKGKKVNNPNGGTCTDLELAATNNPAVFLSALLEAARLGLEPGTEQYYLTPRMVGGKNGHLEILGIPGYQGYIELMYRAGAVSSVVAECVYTADSFVWNPGRLDTEMIDLGKSPRWLGPQERPLHEIDWDAEDRGTLRLVYAYALMKGGGTSRVPVLNKAAIARIKLKSAGSSYDNSPWKQDEPAMWLKSAVRQLKKWVPTSAEYRREQLRAVREVEAEASGKAPAGFAPVISPVAGSWDDEDGDVVDVEFVEDHDHSAGYDPSCAACRAESAAMDRAAAS
jgi:recombination protein RecT